MANGYGSSSNSSSSSSSSSRVVSTPAVAPPGCQYMPNGTLMSNAEVENITLQRAAAPPGYHYMPDGSLMLDSEMPTQVKTITSFDLDFSDLPATSETRAFNIRGVNGAKFKLEVKDNTTGYYYNFVTNAFQVSPSSLQEKIVNTIYSGNITFPAVTGSDDQYDIFLYAVPSSIPGESTIHDVYNEVRFGDGSLDINSSTGSNSLMMQKVIYQYAALTLTLSAYRVTGAASAAGSNTDATISINRGKSKTKTAFSVARTAATTAAYRILRQPTSNDVLAFVAPVLGSTPIDLPGENIYPTARTAFTGDDVNGAVTSGTSVRMDAVDISANIAAGDKITSPLTSTGVDGLVSNSNRIVLDVVADTVTAVGDSISINGEQTYGGDIVTVTHINPDSDNNKEIQVSVASTILDGATIGFSSEVNRSLTTVVAFPVTATDFTMSQAIQFRDDQPLTFTPRMNYGWSVDNYANLLKPGMIIVPATNVTTDTSIGVYEDIITLFAGTKDEKKIIKNRASAVDTLGKKPAVAKGLVTVQEGRVVFDKQQVLALAGDTLKIGGYGESEILRVYGWEVKFTDLAIALTAPTTTTTETSAGGSSADIEVTSREGVINNVSRVSGIGINPALQNPLITSGGGATGTGDWTMDAVQTLENGITLTIENTGRVATITGNIEIIKAGNSDQTLRFDIEQLISTLAP